MNKKGFVFSFIIVVLVIATLYVSTSQSQPNVKEKQLAIEDRVSSLNQFMKNLDKDLARAVYIISFRSLMGLTQYASENATYIDDVNLRFSEAFLNETINGQTSKLVENSTFYNWTKQMQDEAKKSHVILNITANDIVLSQNDPWHVQVDINLTLNIKDDLNIASWKLDKQLITNISIEELEDPIYSLNSLGSVINTITKSNFTDFVVNNDTTNLELQLNYSRYITSPTAPSFLMRLSGNLSNSTNGIESLVNLKTFEDQGLVIKNRTVVDYLYFSNVTINNQTKIATMPSWFILDYDHNHLETYNSTKLVIN